MKILATGDWHYRASRPVSRRDDYVATLLGKIEQIRDIAYDEGCEFILQPGDFFDAATPPFWLVRAAIQGHMPKDKWERPGLMVVYGQHDQRYHSSKVENTPIALMEAAGVLEVLDCDPFVFDTKGPDAGQKVAFYGASWADDIPTPDPEFDITVLVMHRMVIGDKKLWEAQEEYDWGRAILRRNKFDLIVTGDNHHFFTDSVPGDRHLVNCGSLMRANIDQTTHEPAVVIYDTRTRKIKTVKLKVAPAEEVFNMEAAEAEKERNAELHAFIEQIGKTSGAPDLDFLGNLSKLARADGVPPMVTELVDKIVEESSNG